MVDFDIFDAQVNYGKSVFGPDCNLNLYLENQNIHLKKVIIIPSPTHEHAFGKEKEKSCLWEEKNGKINYSKIIYSGGKRKSIKNPINPYLRFNKFVLNFFGDFNKKSKIDFFVAPKLHPKLDNEDAFKEIIKHPLTKAIKIHGLATHSTPKDMPDWIVDFSKKHKIPFFIHTDYYNSLENLDGFGKEMLNVISKNNARDWFDWAVFNKLRAFLAHGASLDLDVIEEVNNSKGFILGIGPESLNQKEQGRLKTPSKNYLKTLMEHTRGNNLAYCSDYRWNISKRGDWNSLDWNGPDKVIKIGRELGFSDKRIRNILYSNACSFFRC